MKKIISFIFVSLFINVCFSQSLQDTKDFITEQVEASHSLPTCSNIIAFDNILSSDADKIANKTLTADERANAFIYARETYSDNDRTNWLGTEQTIIDIRDISKVSTFQKTEGVYEIKVYANQYYYKKMCVSSSTALPVWKDIDSMEIQVADNPALAEKIKKAIIHLCKLKKIDVTDGDSLF
jgi:hypothetical protein